MAAENRDHASACRQSARAKRALRASRHSNGTSVYFFYPQRLVRQRFRAGFFLELRQFQRLDRDLAVGKLVEQVPDQVQPARLLVVEVDDMPGRKFGMGMLQHDRARPAVVAILVTRGDIDRRDLPALERISGALGEALLLFFLVDGEPVLQQQNAVVDETVLEHRTFIEEALVPVSYTH